jgi:streptogramin lyase
MGRTTRTCTHRACTHASTSTSLRAAPGRRPRLGALVVLLLALSSLLNGCGPRAAAANPLATSTPSLTPTPTLTSTPPPKPHISITEFSLPADNFAVTIAAGPDGNLWFTENGPNNALMMRAPFGSESALGGPASGPQTQIGRITPTGIITQFPLTDPDIAHIFLTDIAPGPDGALWFGVGAGGRIGRITTSGSISEFLIPGRPGSTTDALVAGPDGNLWFSDVNIDLNLASIWRVTPSAVFTEFPVPSAPVDMAVGPDHALWFTESSTDKIGRITTSGAVTEFPLPPPTTPGSQPEDIAAGPDHALWFTDTTAGKIGRITTSGAVTEFPLPAAASQPEDIAAGPDGALWFTDPVIHEIGRITTSGTITEFALSKPDRRADSLTLGPHHKIWFTEGSAHGGKIGRLSLT